MKALPPPDRGSFDLGKPGKNEGGYRKSDWMPRVDENSPWLSIPTLIVSFIVAGIWYWARHH